MGSSPIPATRPVGQAVKTPPFHGGNMGSIPVRVTNTKAPMQSHRCFCIGDPYEESHPAMQAARLALRVRIRRSKIGERLAQRDILQAQSERIFALCAKFPCFDLAVHYFIIERTGTSSEVSVLFLLPHTRNLTRQCKPQARLAGSHTPPGVTRQKQFSIVFAKESPKQGVGRAECIEATGDDYATACRQGKCPRQWDSHQAQSVRIFTQRARFPCVRVFRFLLTI